MTPPALSRLFAPLLFAVVIVVAISLVQGGAYLNHDVGWFSWGARSIWNGAVPGRDLIEPNFPLAFLVYLPAVGLAEFVGLPAGVKLWLMMLTLLSMALSAGRLDEEQRVPVVAALGLFIAFAFPREFAQREQIALLLVVPYCLPAEDRRSRGVLIGVMAGIGFAIKPHFLIALALCELGKRPLRLEQRALIVTGGVYLAVLLLLFPTFLSDMLPITRSLYWTFDRPSAIEILILPACLAILLLGTSLFVRNRTSIALSLAALGFLAAALAQQRFYTYQVLPAWGMIVLTSTSLLASKRTRLAGIAGLAFVVPLLVMNSLPWWRDAEGRTPTISALTAELDRHPSFGVISAYPFPAFPTALYTSSAYLGTANSHWYLPAAAQSKDERLARSGERLAWAHAVAEIEREPAVVLVDRHWARHTVSGRRGWDGLKILLRDRRFATQWRKYRRTRTIAGYDVYVRSE